MELVWSPETALKAYIDTVKSCEIFKDSSVAELISAMAAGWNSKLIVETWSHGGATTTSIGLDIASRHTSGRHVCIVPDELSQSEYIKSMENAGMSPEVIVGEPEEAFRGLMGIDFLVLNCKKDHFPRLLRVAKLGHRGAVIVCKNISGGSRGESEIRWRAVVDGVSRLLVRSVILPVGEGLDIAHIGASGGRVRESRWIKHIDTQSGEEFVIKK